MTTPAILAAALAGAPAAAAPDLAKLWDFSDPAGSERRLREAAATAKGDDVLVLETQVARSWGLRGDFGRARAILAGLEPRLATAGPEPRVRYELESGRTWASATHPAGSQTPETRAKARAHFDRAIEQARAARLDGLAIDAIHMMAFLDTAPPDQERWAREALALSLASTQEAARRWEPSIRNNLGYALLQQGRNEEALAEFEKALALREASGNAAGTRSARWMVARTLRAMGRADEAMAIQRRLEHEAEAAGKPDPHVFEELEILLRERGDEAEAARYAARRRALP